MRHFLASCTVSDADYSYEGSGDYDDDDEDDDYFGSEDVTEMPPSVKMDGGGEDDVEVVKDVEKHRKVSDMNMISHCFKCLQVTIVVWH